MVFYGSIKKHSGISVPVTRMLRHPFFFKQSFQNDVCLLTVQRPMRFNEMVKPICLPLNPVDLYQKNVRIAGWGRLNVSKKFSSFDSIKIRYRTKLFSCLHQIYAGNDFNKKFMFCAYGGHTDACSGDSGAPVLSQAEDGRFFIVGIISYGVGCAVDGRPAVYARVSTYTPWILRNIGKAQKYTRLSLE
ncbi:serine protease, putative [Ixodes scapularis]|uniref:Serine protease, putative n=1 Tax=Ixodes scapularis TaxID=6945 RepID=B7QAI1_IXOSC|nr:serine protease, putative [Ixodes scapularis]|eukprot:XP_002412557.1 serine protease, putative [Ixodes scapularis]